MNEALPPLDPERVLADLNPEQREAAQAVRGPVVVLAGAGTGKTRVISHRVAYAVATGAVDERLVLVVSFTTKAAGEMADRLRALGLRRATASTLHAAARRQLVHFWPTVRGRELPEPMESKVPILVPIARALPGNYRFTPAKGLAEEIEWAKNRRVQVDRYANAVARAKRTPPIPVDLMRRAYAEYERVKARSGDIDFEDLLEEAIRLYAEDDAAIALVRRRFAWFSVDEYQDTNPLQQALLDAWLGDRRDIGVVGDPNQTIYSFSGASPEYLLGFRQRYPDATQVSLVRNYRSTPQVLALANRLIQGDRGPRLESTSGDGPEPGIVRCHDAHDEGATIVRDIGHLQELGIPAEEIAVLTRTNAQLDPIADRLRGAGIAFRFKGTPFYRTPHVREAIRALGTSAVGVADVVETVAERWKPLGFVPGVAPRDASAAERQSSFEALLAIAERFALEHPGTSLGDLVGEYRRLAQVEAAQAAEGVTLSTIHAAKGAEWQAVFVAGVEEGSLPIRYAFADPAAIAEERRLLYVALTRAARHLTVTWAATRQTAKGSDAKQRPSRFIAELKPPAAPTGRAVAIGSARRERRSDLFRGSGGGGADRDRDQQSFERLAEWRRDRARRDGVPAYVVAHDAHLRAIAAARPRTVEALLSIPGMGPVKVERYGEEILAALPSEP
ncbi:MAG TPA: ATP-dependent DNA helicase UvrD2 [Candidatus Limnocylindria bacterium]|nr:ATP-dependent DNA helicase UvrD2 [Candidatus Limnocylindria bacterium]